MLLRVAAVKAPRIHNRRRVTGSSGRRREGRESEPQRPNMSRRLFTSAALLLFVVMVCCGSGGAAVTGVKESSDPQFVWNKIPEGETVESLGFPSLLKVGSDVFAVAEAQCKKGQDSFTGIASQLLTETEEKKDNTPVEVLNDANTKTQVLEEGTSPHSKKVDVSRPTTAVKGNDIYMLAGKYSRAAATNPQERGAGDWGLLLVKGEVSSEESNKKIQWNKNQRLVGTFSDGEQDSLMQLVAGGGSGVQTDDDTLVFPVEGKKEKNGESNDGKTVSLVIYTSKDTLTWKLSKGMSADGCSYPSVVEWEEGKLMMMTACDGGRRRVYESGDKGASWTEALGTLSRVWGNKHEEQTKRVASGFTTATFENGDDNKKVMLVTLPVYSKERGSENKEKSELHLWLADNTRIVDIGPVSEKDEDEVAASSLLYKSAGGEDNNNEDKLIALYEKKKKGNDETSHSLLSVRLTAQLERVKEVLKTWKEVDERISQLCPTSSAAKSALADNACSAAMPTDGLVGFLSGSLFDKIWKDEYLGVNATVNNNEWVEQTDNGVTFTERGAGAEWPVGKQGENQLYHFANYNFTLVATVSIDGEPRESPFPLLGVRAGSNGGKKLMELSYDSGKKWQLLCGDETNKEHSSTWKRGRTHQVAIVLQNGKQVSAYVDGQRVGNALCELKNRDSEEISHFYIGGDGGSADNTESREGVSVTVSNVLLYNRPLTFSGGSADVEEVTDSPSKDIVSPPGNLQPTETVSQSVEEDEKKAPPATKPSEAPVVQATLQRPRQESEAKQVTTVGKSATTHQLPANTSQGSVGKAAASSSHAVGGATGDGSTVYESGLLPSLLLLLGLWGLWLCEE
ncbi:putative trans-sialidase, Group V [Trypanosoma cruzi]|uniref:Trans-sialidase, putative n=2 Tax=Trypanosoma cruzi TaxID=5693 RepID=Q4D070_TRYCC|nr:trans-sialidase, putative [Trypanosoma cruzi]EAN85921.1 trans-sialidase, putative [Trypanosoma cruzi]PWV08171.1 putative trans-sialidase, Group V [Trypanosoma cruzi]|eukprot:XP_807772.1 trans-sialidase [Trypanosoma cruzi strain CL Brener]